MKEQKKQLNCIDLVKIYGISAIVCGITVSLKHYFSFFYKQILLTPIISRQKSFFTNKKIISIDIKYNLKQILRIKQTKTPLLRSIFFTGFRLGTYRISSVLYRYYTDIDKLSFFDRVICCIISGTIQTLIGSPMGIYFKKISEYVNPNFQNLKNNIDSSAKIWNRKLFILCREVFINIGMLGSYDQLKANFHQPKPYAYLICSFLSGLFTSIIGVPFLNAKYLLRYKLRKKILSSNQFNSMLKYVLYEIEHEGFSKLWQGYFLYSQSIIPSVMIQLILLEFISKKYNQYFQPKTIVL